MRYNAQYISAEYGVNVFFSNVGEDTHHIQYNAVVRYAGRYKDTQSVIHLYKKDILLDNNNTDDNSYLLAMECSKALFPITVISNQKGLLTAIRTDSVSNNWLEHKESLKYFEGESATRYINETESSLKNEDKLKLLVDRDVFFSNYFRLIYGGTDFSESVRFQMKMPFTSFGEDYIFDCCQQISRERVDSYDDYWIVTQSGISKSQVTAQEAYPFKFQDDSINSSCMEGTMFTEYEVNKGNGRIEKMQHSFILKVGDLILREVKMEAHLLIEKEVLPCNDEDIEQMQNSQKKQNFFSRLFE